MLLQLSIFESIQPESLQNILKLALKYKKISLRGKVSKVALVFFFNIQSDKIYFSTTKSTDLNINFKPKIIFVRLDLNYIQVVFQFSAFI